MTEDELDSFDTAWNKYMGDQALMIEPFPEPSADGNLLNHEESVAFSRFFDNLLAQPSSPRRTARRLDEELQRLSYSTQPYAAAVDAHGENMLVNPDGYPAHGHDLQHAHTPQQQAHISMPPPNLGAPGYPVDQRPFLAGPHVYGDMARAYAAGPSAHEQAPDHGPAHHSPAHHGPAHHGPAHHASASYLSPSYAANDQPHLVDAYGGVKPLKQEPLGPGMLGHDRSHGNKAHFDYAMGCGLPPPDAYADPQLDPQFYPAPLYMDQSSAAATSRSESMTSSSLSNDAKRQRVDLHPPPEKRVRTQRGEAQIKLNHMNSEKRRRAHIRDLFDRMCGLVPRVMRAEETLPKSIVLQETHNRLLELETQNARLRDRLGASGIDTSRVPAIILDHNP